MRANYLMEQVVVTTSNGRNAGGLEDRIFFLLRMYNFEGFERIWGMRGASVQLEAYIDLYMFIVMTAHYSPVAK